VADVDSRIKSIQEQFEIVIKEQNDIAFSSDDSEFSEDLKFTDDGNLQTVQDICTNWINDIEQDQGRVSLSSFSEAYCSKIYKINLSYLQLKYKLIESEALLETKTKQLDSKSLNEVKSQIKSKPEL